MKTGCCKGSLGFQSVLFETGVIKGVEALSVGPSRLQWRGGVWMYAGSGYWAFAAFCTGRVCFAGLELPAEVWHPDPVKAMLYEAYLLTAGTFFAMCEGS